MIYIHDFKSNSYEGFDLIEDLLDNYILILFDLRAHGLSNEDLFTYG
jgi:hypothetical protein